MIETEKKTFYQIIWKKQYFYKALKPD